MTRRIPIHHVIIDGREISQHVLTADFKIRPGNHDILILELLDPTIHTDPDTGDITFRIGENPDLPDGN